MFLPSPMPPPMPGVLASKSVHTKHELQMVQEGGTEIYTSEPCHKTCTFKMMHGLISIHALPICHSFTGGGGVRVQEKM